MSKSAVLRKEPISLYIVSFTGRKIEFNFNRILDMKLRNKHVFRHEALKQN